MLREEGYRGLFRGFWPTFWRDVPPLGLYFYTYEYLKSRLRGTETSDKFSSRLLSGGAAGTICWLVAFPMDVIKTRMMVSQHNHSIAEAFRYHYAQHGHQVFYKGLTPALMRAFPRHAVVLSVFDVISLRFSS